MRKLSCQILLKERGKSWRDRILFARKFRCRRDMGGDSAGKNNDKKVKKY